MSSAPLSTTSAAGVCLALTLLAATASTAQAAQEVASCGPVAGHAYYHSGGIVTAESAGWQKDGIPGGVTTIVRNDDGKFDILVLDSTKKIKSLREDGGEVMLIRVGPSEATFLYVAATTVEIYSLWKDSSGKAKLDLLQSKGFPSPIGKGSVMVGSCRFLNVDVAAKPVAGQ